MYESNNLYQSLKGDIEPQRHEAHKEAQSAWFNLVPWWFRIIVDSQHMLLQD